MVDKSFMDKSFGVKKEDKEGKSKFFNVDIFLDYA